MAQVSSRVRKCRVFQISKRKQTFKQIHSNKYIDQNHPNSPALQFSCNSESQTSTYLLASISIRALKSPINPDTAQDLEMCLLYMLSALRKNKDGVSEEPNTRPARSSPHRGESPSSRMPGDRVSKSQGKNGGSGGGYEGRN